MDLDRLRRQEPAAFAELVKHHQPILLGLGQSLGLRGADLDDAAAEAFAAVYRALPRFEGKSELGTWIYSIGYRVMLKARTRVRKLAMPELPAIDPTDPSQSAEDKIEADETAEALWAAVATLEPRQAATIEFFYRRQWPIDQIARVLECPEGTVKTLLFRARERLHTILSRQKTFQ